MSKIVSQNNKKLLKNNEIDNLKLDNTDRLKNTEQNNNFENFDSIITEDSNTKNYTNMENEIKNFHEYLTDDRKGSKRSNNSKSKKQKSKEDNEFNNNIIEASIPKFKTIDSKIYYEILIITNMKIFKSCYIRIDRRYSQFNELKKRIKKILNTTLEFPPKRFTFFGISEKIKNERRNMLHPWIKYLFHQSLENQVLMEEIKKFVELDNYPEN